MELRHLERYAGSLADRVYQSLKAAIVQLKYQPGEALKKQDIIDQFGVSRSPVADAVARLAADGLVDIVPQSGTYVSRFSLSEIREGAFLREALELAAVERVAQTRTDEQLVQLQRNVRFQEVLLEDGDFQGFHTVDEEMHALIQSFTGFNRLRQLTETSWVQVNRARQLVLPTPGRAQQSLREHTEIVSAIAAQDAVEARLAMRRHVRKLVAFVETLEAQHPDLFTPTRSPTRE